MKEFYCKTCNKILELGGLEAEWHSIQEHEVSLREPKKVEEMKERKIWCKTHNCYTTTDEDWNILCPNAPKSAKELSDIPESCHLVFVERIRK